MRRCMNRLQRQRKAASTIVNGSWMWRHMRLRRERRQACTKISALWRGYCVRVNVNTTKQAVKKIKIWWRSQIASHQAMEIIHELVLLKKNADGFNEMIRAAQIQRWWRRYRKKGIKALKRAVVVIQSRYR